MTSCCNRINLIERDNYKVVSFTILKEIKQIEDNKYHIVLAKVYGEKIEYLENTYDSTIKQFSNPIDKNFGDSIVKKIN